ncbi:MAG: hypothetical protein C0403_01480 [Desulfobacterium sp.]|nr:hypothetical protein [Desulfobacterium sp.]
MAARNIELKIFLLSCLWVIAVETAWIIFMAGKTGWIALGMLRLLELILVLGTVYYFDRDFKSIALSSLQIMPGLKKGFLWSFVFGIITGILFFILFMNDINPFKLLRVRLPQDTLQKILFFLVGGLIAPVTEETFFRGILYGFFRKWGSLFAISVSTFIFALAHPGVSYVQITGGIVFAISYEKEKNLLVPITIHTLGNLSLFSLSILT